MVKIPVESAGIFFSFNQAAFFKTYSITVSLIAFQI